MRVSTGRLRRPTCTERMRSVRSVRACKRHQHAAAQHRFADVRAGVIGDAAHHIQPGRHARHPDLAAVEKAGEAGRVAVRFAQQLFEFGDFKRERVCFISRDWDDATSRARGHAGKFSGDGGTAACRFSNRYQTMKMFNASTMRQADSRMTKQIAGAAGPAPWADGGAPVQKFQSG